MRSTLVTLVTENSVVLPALSRSTSKYGSSSVAAGMTAMSQLSSLFNVAAPAAVATRKHASRRSRRVIGFSSWVAVGGGADGHAAAGRDSASPSRRRAAVAEGGGARGDGEASLRRHRGRDPVLVGLGVDGGGVEVHVDPAVDGAVGGLGEDLRVDDVRQRRRRQSGRFREDRRAAALGKIPPRVLCLVERDRLHGVGVVVVVLAADGARSCRGLAPDLEQRRERARAAADPARGEERRQRLASVALRRRGPLVASVERPRERRLALAAFGNGPDVNQLAGAGGVVGEMDLLIVA